MENFNNRIINDEYTIGQTSIDNVTNVSEEFKQKVNAVLKMYEWLDKKGILKKISFRYDGDTTGALFSFETKDLLPYRNDMLESNIENADIAVEHIFETPYTPCIKCGGIHLTWTMLTYRNGRSWECNLCNNRNNRAVSAVRDIRQKYGSKKAVCYMWDNFINK